MSTTRQQIFAIAVLVLITAIWGASFILVKWAVVSVDSYAFVSWRFLLAAAALAFFFPQRVQRINGENFRAGMVLGILLGVTLVLQTEGLRFTTASNSALITCLYMVVVPIISTRITDERPSLFCWVGIALALPGLVLLTGFSADGINLGDIITMAVPIVAALHIIYTSIYGRRHSLIPLMIVQFASIGVLCGIVAFMRGTLFIAMPPIGWVALIVTAILASSLAFTVQTWAQRVIDPSRAGVIFALEAAFGPLFGWWWGGEHMTGLALFGAGLMFSGMVLSELKPLARVLFKRFAE